MDENAYAQDQQIRLLTDRLRRISIAWNIPGPAPAVHAKAKADLRKTWPALAQALDALETM